MIKKRNNVVLVLLLVTVTIATIYFLSYQTQEITGMSPTRVGRATITFNGTPPPPPPPPPSSGGGSSAGQAQCCNYTRYEEQEYECRCYIYDHEVVRMQPTICCDDPTNPKCLPFCNPVQKPMPPPAQGVCPIKQMCGEKCCKEKEYCRNGKCLKELPAPPIQMQLPPPEIEQPYLVAIPYTEYAFPWWYFVLAILILLILTYLLLRQPKRATTRETPNPTPVKRIVKHRKRKRK